jgi:hypothetical protein
MHFIGICLRARALQKFLIYGEQPLPRREIEIVAKVEYFVYIPSAEVRRLAPGGGNSL